MDASDDGVQRHLQAALEAWKAGAEVRAGIQLSLQHAELQLAAAQAERQQQEAAHAATKATLHTCQQSCDALKRQLQALHSTLDAERAAHAADNLKLLQAQQQVAVARADASSSQAKAVDAARQAAHAGVQQELMQARMQLADAEHDRQQLEQQLLVARDELQAARHAAAAAIAGNDQQGRESAGDGAAGSQLQQLRQQLEHYQELVKQQQRQLRHQQHDVQALQAQVASLSDHNSLLEVRSAGLAQQLEVAKAHLARSVRQFAQRQQQQAMDTPPNVQLQQELRSSQQQVAQLSEQLRQQQQQVDRLSQQLASQQQQQPADQQQQQQLMDAATQQAAGTSKEYYKAKAKRYKSKAEQYAKLLHKMGSGQQQLQQQAYTSKQWQQPEAHQPSSVHDDGHRSSAHQHAVDNKLKGSLTSDEVDPTQSPGTSAQQQQQEAAGRMSAGKPAYDGGCPGSPEVQSSKRQRPSQQHAASSPGSVKRRLQQQHQVGVHPTQQPAGVGPAHRLRNSPPRSPKQLAAVRVVSAAFAAAAVNGPAGAAAVAPAATGTAAAAAAAAAATSPAWRHKGAALRSTTGAAAAIGMAGQRSRSGGGLRLGIHPADTNEPAAASAFRHASAVVHAAVGVRLPGSSHPGKQHAGSGATCPAASLQKPPQQQQQQQCTQQRMMEPAAVVTAARPGTTGAALTGAMGPPPAPGSGGGGGGGAGLTSTAAAAAQGASSSSDAGSTQPVQQQHTAFKYREVVRKQAKRDVLPAFECAACSSFYAALSSWGVGAGEGAQLALPGCGHTKSASVAAAAAGVAVVGPAAAAQGGATGSVNQQQQQQLAQALLQQTGRHRARWQMPSTPQGYWNIGFSEAASLGEPPLPLQVHHQHLQVQQHQDHELRQQGLY